MFTATITVLSMYAIIVRYYRQSPIASTDRPDGGAPVTWFRPPF
jgi:hypothetical protein